MVPWFPSGSHTNMQVRRHGSQVVPTQIPNWEWFPCTPSHSNYVTGRVRGEWFPQKHTKHRPTANSGGKQMFTEVLPLAGPRTRPALDAAEALLADNQWHPWTEVVGAMLTASDVKAITASNRLHNLVTLGVLERQGRHPKRELRMAQR